jgi:hypothetical protein
MTSSDSQGSPEQLLRQRIISLPDSIYYIPGFLNDQELSLVESKVITLRAKHYIQQSNIQ